MVELLKRGIIARRLYRPTLAKTLAGILITILAVPSAAQLRTTKPPKGPRAIGVIRWQPNAQGKAVARLLPVAILDGGKYYDASLFRATPRPMALDPGVVYEGQDKGDLLGYFTVQNATRNATTRQWVGLGEWQSSTRSSTELELRDRPQTAEVVKDGQRATSPIFTEPVDDRDIKKKATVYDEEGREIPAGQEPDDDAPPTLKRKQGDIDRLPQVAPPTKKKEVPAPASADDDPDRPRLKRGGSAGQQPAGAQTTTPAAAPASTTPTPKASDDDPNRPILRRGGGGQQKTGISESGQSAGTTVPGRVQARGEVVAGARQANGFATRTFEAVAISDAEDAQFRQDYRFRWTESEREDVTARMRTLVQVEVAKFLRTSEPNRATKSAITAKGARRGTTQAPATPPLDLTDVQLSGLDLDANNSAELVFTGRARLDSLDSGKTLFVTLVARTDVNGNPRKLFSVVTSSDRLDVSPRLELVDAVDADGDRRGELLFRRIRENSAEFVIYRVGADTLTELFHGGNAE